MAAIAGRNGQICKRAQAAVGHRRIDQTRDFDDRTGPRQRQPHRQLEPRRADKARSCGKMRGICRLHSQALRCVQRRKADIGNHIRARTGHRDQRSRGQNRSIRCRNRDITADYIGIVQPDAH